MARNIMEFTITAVCGQIISADTEEEAKDLFFRAVEDGDVTVLDKTLKVIHH